MTNMVSKLLDRPDELEALYHNDSRQFEVWLQESLQQLPQSETLRVWRARLAVPDQAQSRANKTPLIFVIGLSLLAGFVTRLPVVFGIKESWYYPRFVPIIVIGALAAYYMRSSTGTAMRQKVLVGLLLCAIFMGVLPSDPDSASIIMSQVHMPLVLAALLGIAFMAENWKSPDTRLSYVRYIGEAIIYATLILLGGIVLTALTLGLFGMIGLSIETWYLENIVIFGLVASPIVGTYLYDSVLGSQSKLATLLSNVFSPLFLVTVVIYLFAIITQGKNPYTDRNFLIVFNGLLVVIWGISVFSISGKNSGRESSLQDYVNVALLAVTLVINAVALSAMLYRWSEYGITPNRVAVTGANLLIFVHLILILKEYLRHIKKRGSPAALISAVANYLPIYSGWSLFVVVVLPLLFWFH